jgi:uncharacterized membrane protein HdeD (DUF308 family)
VAITVNEASAVLRAAVQDNFRRRTLLYLVQGGILVLAGALALVFPIIFGAGVMVLIGWLLIIAGIVQVIGLIGAAQVPYFWLQLVSVMLSLVVGWLLITRPEAGLLGIALMVLVFFVVEGMARIAFALMIRPMDDWGWILASGLVGLLAALVLAANLGSVGYWLLGFLLGIKLISVGGAQAWLAWHLRRETQEGAAHAG